MPDAHSNSLAEIVDDTSAWIAADYSDERQWLVQLTDAHVKELVAALPGAKAQGDAKGLGFRREDFDLPTLGPILEDLSDEIQDGRGFAVLRGIDTQRHSEEDLAAMVWGIGTYFGSGIYQNKDGDLIGSVKDYGERYEGGDPYLSGVRFYRTSADLPPHTDSCDVVGLMCVRQPLKGGESGVVSAMALHNEIVRTRPDLVAPLHDGFHIDLVGKGTADNQVSHRRIPVFSWFDGKLSCRYNKRQIELGAEKSGDGLSSKHQEAIDYVRQLSIDPRFKLSMILMPGDLQFLNNRTTLHSREGFEDGADEAQRRLMFRLWLITPDGRPLAPEMADQLNTGPRGAVQPRT